MICLVLFRNCHFQNAVSMFTNVVHINVENDNVASTLSNVVHINVEIHNIYSRLFDVVNSNVKIHNVGSTLIWRCLTSRRRTNRKTTLKQRWNVCWEMTSKWTHAHVLNSCSLVSACNELINTLECNLFFIAVIHIKTSQLITSLKKQALKPVLKQNSLRGSSGENMIFKQNANCKEIYVNMRKKFRIMTRLK